MSQRTAYPSNLTDKECALLEPLLKKVLCGRKRKRCPSPISPARNRSTPCSICWPPAAVATTPAWIASMASGVLSSRKGTIRGMSRSPMGEQVYWARAKSQRTQCFACPFVCFLLV